MIEIYIWFYSEYEHSRGQELYFDHNLKFWPCTNEIYKSGRTSITMNHEQRDSPHRIDEYLRNLLLTLKSDVDDKGTKNDIRV